MQGDTVLRRQVRVRNASYADLGPTSVKRARSLVIRGDAVISETSEDGRTIRAANLSFPWPVAIRLLKMLNVPFYVGSEHYSRTGVLRRDRHKCAYCDKHGDTVDHIVPRSRGGEDSWENGITACSPCNRRKRNRTPEEAGMPLLYRPTVPQRVYLTGSDRRKGKRE